MEVVLRSIVAVAFVLLGVFPQASAQESVDSRELRAQLRSEDWNERRMALIRLAPTLKLHERPAVFRPLFDDEYYQVRETAIEMLFGTQDSTLVEPLLAHCSDPHPDVREAAVGTLQGYSGALVAEAIAARMNDRHAPVRRRAIAYFKAHDSPAGRAALVLALSDDEALNRLRAVEALTDFAAAEADTVLAQMISQDPDPRVRREAARSFLSIDSHEGLLAVAKALASEPDASVRSTFVFTLKNRTRQDYGEDSRAWLGWLTESSR